MLEPQRLRVGELLVLPALLPRELRQLGCLAQPGLGWWRLPAGFLLEWL
jgi:hypothetical protein